MSVKGVISITDNASEVFKQIRKEQSAFRKDVEETKKTLISTWDKEYKAKINATPAMAAAKKLSKSLDPLRKKVVNVITTKDAATEKVKSITNKVKAVGKMVVSPVVKVKDAATSVVKKVSSSIKSIAKPVTIALSVTGAAAVAAALGSVKSGMELETQMVSMKHFIDINNKDLGEGERQKISDDFVRDLRQNANATPFETGEVIKAGTRAVGLTGGDTAEAMELVKVAEDMAALTPPGKTISDAMEALADAKNGEMERLKEFNAKVTAEEFDSLGFGGVVEKKLKTQYTGTVPTYTKPDNNIVPQINIESVDTAKEQILRANEISQQTGKSFRNYIPDFYNKAFEDMGGAHGIAVEGLKQENGKNYIVTINKNSVGKVVSDTNLSAEKLAIFDNLDDVVENGEYVGSGQYIHHGGKVKNVIRYDYFETPVKIGKENYIVSFDVEVGSGNKNYRTHRVVNEISLTQISSGEIGQLPTSQDNALDLFGSNISQPQQIVNASAASQRGNVDINSSGVKYAGVDMQAKAVYEPVKPAGKPIIPEGYKERGFAESVRTKTDLPIEIKQEYVSDPDIYKALSNQATYDTASKIMANGVDNAKLQFDSLTAAKNPVSIPLGYNLAKQYISNKDYDAAATILRTMSLKLTESGQFSQAAAMLLMKESPETAARYLQKELDTMNIAGKKSSEIDGKTLH